MTQGAGQGPEMRTPTVRDFRVPAYVNEAGPYTQSPGPYTQSGEVYDQTAEPYHQTGGSYAEAPDAYARPVPHARQTPPGENAGPAGEPEGYTPTQRDLPVINRGDTVQVHGRPRGRTGHPVRRGARAAVRRRRRPRLSRRAASPRCGEKGLIDIDGQLGAGTSRLWFLGDFTDRGPDGIGVIDLVMRLSAEAAAAGGYCKALMGNHELLLLGAKRFGDTPVNSGAGTATFQAAWLLNGGQKTDMERLQDHHLQWMARLDAMEMADGHLLVHSDTTAYLDYGDSIEAVNDTVRETLTRNDADECWDLFRKFTKRFAFRDDGRRAGRALLAGHVRRFAHRPWSQPHSVSPRRGRLGGRRGLPEPRGRRTARVRRRARHRDGRRSDHGRKAAGPATSPG